MLKCKQLCEYMHKGLPELQKPDGTSQGSSKVALMHLEPKVSGTTNAVL